MGAIETELINYHLPFSVLAVIIGFQISFYFFYQYYKAKDEGLSLNKVLLAYGFLYGYIFSAILVRLVYTYLIHDEVYKSLFYDISHIIVASGAVNFLLIISIKDFNNIIPQKQSRVVIILAISISALTILINNQKVSIFLVMVALMIAFVYFVLFHFRLTKYSTGSIKKRLNLIFLGNIVMGMGILAQADEFILLLAREEQIYLMISSAPILMSAELLIFLGIFNFPAFLEFDWKKHIISLYIMNWRNMNLLYEHNFNSKNDEIFDREGVKNQKGIRISRSVVGIDNIMTKLTKKKRKSIATIEQENSTFLVHHGEAPFKSVVFILLVDKNMNSFEFFLKRVRSIFQSEYKSVLLNLDLVEGHELEVFSSFDNKLNTIMSV